jgi:sugar phosphate isomerase/epimerase
VIKSSNLFISTQCLKKSGIIDSVDSISEITPNIELSGGYQYDENLLGKLKKIRSRKNLNLLVHGYFPPPKDHFVLNFADTGEKTRGFIRETMRFIDELDIDYYSAHSGFKRDFDVRDEMLINPRGQHYTLTEIYKNIDWFGKEFPDKKLAIENLYPNNQDPETCLLMHINEITEFLRMSGKTYLLLDLGHLKISSGFFGFNYLNAVRCLFEEYGDRILEIHLSENAGSFDDHFIIYVDSIQHMIVKKYADIIDKNKINVTIESRNSSMDKLLECFFMMADAIGYVREYSGK